MTSIHFDTIDYVRELRNVGVAQEVAEVQAKAMERVINEIENNQDLASKYDVANAKNELRQNIQLDLANLRVELIKWILSVGIATILALAGIVKYIH